MKIDSIGEENPHSTPFRMRLFLIVTLFELSIEYYGCGRKYPAPSQRCRDSAQFRPGSHEQPHQPWDFMNHIRIHCHTAKYTTCRVTLFYSTLCRPCQDSGELVQFQDNPCGISGGQSGIGFSSISVLFLCHYLSANAPHKS